MNEFSNAEMADMHYVYGAADGNGRGTMEIIQNLHLSPSSGIRASNYSRPTHELQPNATLSRDCKQKDDLFLSLHFMLLL